MEGLTDILLLTEEDEALHFPPIELANLRHLAGKHDQKTHGKGVGKAGAGIDAKAVEADLASGKKVTVDPADVDDLMAEFADGPVFNLKHMQVSGSENKNCYRKNLREIPRSEMPQLPQNVEQIGAFKAKLAEHGISASLEEVDPRSLVATQNELNAQKVAKIFGSIRSKGWADDNIMFISREGAVLDGHHRWAAASAAAIAGTKVKMRTVRVDTDIDTLLAIANTVSLEKKTLARSRVDFSEEPTTSPPDPDEPWIWLDGRWYFVVTDTGDGVPEELSFPEPEDDRSLPWGTYVAPRHLAGKHDQKTHGKGGKVGDVVRGSDQTEWAAEITRDGYSEHPLMQSRGLKDPRDTTLMAIGKQQGFDGKPTIGSVDDTVAAGGTEIWRGSAKDTNDKMIDGDYEPGTGLYGNGYYFSNKQRVAEHFAKLDINGQGFSDTVARRANGTAVRAALKPGAKVADYDQLQVEMKAWKADVAPKTQDLGDLYKSDFKTPNGMYSPHMVDYIMADPGRYAAIKGYDAIKVVGYQDGAPAVKGEPTAKGSSGRGRFSANDQYVILNRTALVFDKPSDKPKRQTLKLKDSKGNVLDEVDITGMEE